MALIIKKSSLKLHKLAYSPLLQHFGNCFQSFQSIFFSLPFLFSKKVMAFTSLGVVLVSTLTFVLGTFPEFQSFAESGTPEEYPEAVAAMSMIDNVLVGFFVIEYVVSFFPFT